MTKTKKWIYIRRAVFPNTDIHSGKSHWPRGVKWGDTCAVNPGMIGVVVMVVQVGDEACSCLLRVVKILPGQLNPTHHQLTGHSYLHHQAAGA